MILRKTYASLNYFVILEIFLNLYLNKFNFTILITEHKISFISFLWYLHAMKNIIWKIYFYTMYAQLIYHFDS